MSPGRIGAVGVVVPARDEQDRLARCLRALDAAAAGSPVPVAVCVVADRCRDATAAVARAVWGSAPGRRLLVNQAELPVGRVRDLGVRALTGELAGPAERTWLLHTDADTTVPPGWVADHLGYADAGADAVVGLVDLDSTGNGPGGLDGAGGLPAAALRRYAELVAAGTGRHRHRHAYAANLGVRASAYAHVGGFPAVTAGEEHALLALLLRAGHRVMSPTDVRVRTSARLHGRARGGLADLLHGLAIEAGGALASP